MFCRPELFNEASGFTRIWRLLAAVIVFACVCSNLAVAEEPDASAVVDELPLNLLVQNSEKTKKVEFSWGWIRWVMSAEVDPKAEMTFGIVHVNAGQTNPVHIHGNCEEILYMVSGSCEHKLGEKSVVLKAGDVIRIPRGVHHSARTFEKEPMRAIIVYNAGQRDFQVIEE
jgi:mannose-6-phosphate isomerase-like protein (cupin superfamily)